MAIFSREHARRCKSRNSLGQGRSAARRRRGLRGDLLRIMRAESLEKREMLAGDGGGSSAQELLPAQALTYVYGALNTLDAVGRHLEGGLDSLRAIGPGGAIADDVIQLLAIDEIPLVEEGLSELADIGGYLRELALRAGTSPIANLTDGSTNPFGELTASEPINIITDGGIARFDIPAFDPTSSEPTAAAEQWATRLNEELVGTPLEMLVDWRVLDDPDGSGAGPVLALAVETDSATGPRSNAITVTAGGLDVHTPAEFGQPEDNVAFQVRFTLSTLDGSSTDTPRVIEFGETDALDVLLLAERDAADPSNPAPITGDNVDLEDLADDYNAAFLNVPVEYPADAFGASGGSSSLPPATPEEEGSPITRSLATYFQVVIDDGTLVMVPRHADITSFSIHNSIAAGASAFNGSFSEADTDAFEQLGIQGVRGIAGIDRLTAGVLSAAAGGDESEHDLVVRDQIAIVMDKIGIPEIGGSIATGWQYSDSEDLLTFTVSETLSFNKSVNLDLDRSISLGPLGELELVATANAMAGTDITFRLDVGVYLGAVPGATAIDPDTLLSTLDAGRGLRTAVGIAAANPPSSVVFAEDQMLTVVVDGTNVDAMVLAIATTGNTTVADLADDLSAAMAETDLADRIEVAAVDGVLHLRAIDQGIRTLSFGTLGTAVQAATGFRSRQASTDLVASLGDRVAYPDLRLTEIDGETVLTTHLIDLDDATALSQVAIAITNQTGPGITATFEDGCLRIHSDTNDFRIDAADSYGLRSFASLVLGIDGGARLVNDADPSEGYRLEGQSLASVPLDQRMFIMVPPAGESNLDLSIAIGASDLRVGAALGLIEFSLVTDPDADDPDNPVDPLNFAISLPISLKAPTGSSTPDRITIGDFLRSDLGDFFAPVNVGPIDLGGTLHLVANLFDNPATAETDFQYAGSLATLGISLATPGDLSSIQITPTDVGFQSLLNQLRQIDLEDILQVAKGFLQTLAADDASNRVLDAKIPLVDASLNDIIDFANQILEAVDGVVASVEGAKEEINDAVNRVESAVSNLPVPQELKVRVRDAIQSVRRVINIELDERAPEYPVELARIPRRFIAAFGQLQDLVGDLIESMDESETGSAPASGALTDVNGDGSTTPTDALVIINRLNRGSGGSLAVSPGTAIAMDVNRDGKITAIDALMVINVLNRRSSGERSGRGSGEGEPPSGAPSTLTPLQQQLMDAIAGLRSFLPTIGDIAQRVAEAVRNQLPVGSDFEFRFDIITDFDGDDSPAEDIAIIAGFEADYALGPYAFNPTLDLPDLGPITINVGATANLEGSIHLGLGFGVAFNPLDPSTPTTFLIADDTGVANENVVATEIIIEAGFDAVVNASVALGGLDLVGVEGSFSLGSDDGPASLRAGLDPPTDPSTALGRIGAVSFGDASIDFTATGGVEGSLSASLLGRTIDDAISLSVPFDDLSAATFNFDASQFETLFSELDFDLAVIIEGIDAFLGLLEVQLRDNLSELPLIGGGLESISELITDLRSGIIDPIQSAINTFGPDLEALEAKIDELITDALVDAGLLPVGNEIVVDLTSDRLEVSGELLKSYVLADVDFDSNFGGLPLSAQGGVMLTLDVGINLGLGISRADGFYLLASDEKEIFVRVEATIDPDTALELDLFILSVTARDDMDDSDDGPGSSVASGVSNPDPMAGGGELDPQRTRAVGEISLDFGSSGRVTISELFSQIEFGASMAVTLDLELEARTGLDLAKVTTELQAGWGFEFSTATGFVSSDPYFRLNDISLNLGEFLGKTIAPTIRKLDDVIGPVRDVVDLLTTPIPGVSQLAVLAGSDPVTLLDLALAEMPAGAAAAARKFVSVITGIDDVTGKIADLLSPEGPDSQDLILNFGSIAFDDDGLNTSGWNLGDPFDDGIAPSTNNLSENVFGSLGRQADSLLSSLSAEPAGGEEDEDGLGIEFPIFEPTNIIKLLLGQTVDLVTWDIPKLELGFGWSQTFPIFPVPPISVSVGLDVGFSVDLLVGLDTRGLKTGGLLDGFYLGDLDPDTDVDIEEFVFSLGISLAALLDVGVASAGIEGEIRGELGANFRDPDQNGKLYIDELVDIVREEGIECLFDLEARVSAILRVVFKVLFFEGSIDIIDVLIFEANNEGRCPPVNPAHVSDGMESTGGFANALPEHLKSSFAGGDVAPAGTLIIHSGDYANQRRRGATDTDEDFKVTWIATGVVRVEGMGLKREYPGVDRILFDGGAGVDTLNLRTSDEDDPATAPQFPIRVIAHGGFGNDVLMGGLMNDWLIGGLGDDELVGNDGDDYLSGNAGNDLVDGGGGNDFILGGAGRDSLIGGDGNDFIAAGTGQDNIDGGDGDDVIGGGLGNDVIFAGAGMDRISGDDGDDYIDAGPGDDPQIVAGAGNDLVIGGDGEDVIYGGWGNDTLISHLIQVGGVGGNDEDYVEGGPDNDFICGSAGANELHGGTTDRGILESGIPLDTIVPLTTGGYDGAITSCFTEAPEPLPPIDPGSMSGSVWRDSNGNKIRDIGEPLFDGITVRIFDGDGALAAETTTGSIDLNGNGRIEEDAENGQWSVDRLEPGSYRVEVVVPLGFLQTAPPFPGEGTSPDYLVDLAGGAAEDELAFGLVKRAVIQGVKYLDLNGDGVRDRGEPGLPGVQIEATFLGGGPEPTFGVTTMLDDPETVEDETGRYELSLWTEGDYEITELLGPSGLVTYGVDSPVTFDTVPSFPASPSRIVSAVYEQVIDNFQFGNAPASEIHVVLTQDPNTDEPRERPPVSVAGIEEFSDFYFVELWVSARHTDRPIVDVATEVRYSTEFTTAVDGIVYGTAFSATPTTPVITDVDPDPMFEGTGTIKNLSSSGQFTEFAEQYLLFARIPFIQLTSEQAQEGQRKPVLQYTIDDNVSEIGVVDIGATRPYTFEVSDARLFVNAFDLNDDDSVTVDDVADILFEFGNQVDDAGVKGPRVDINQNGIIDLGDLALLVGTIGSSPAASSPAAPPAGHQFTPASGVAELHQFTSASGVAELHQFTSASGVAELHQFTSASGVAELHQFTSASGVAELHSYTSASGVAELHKSPAEVQAAPSVIYDGDDTIYGWGSNDTIFGDNSVSGQVFSFGGHDTLLGGDGRDVIHGQEEDDILWGGDDIDPNNIANDSSENDLLVGGLGFDQVRQLAADDQTLFFDILNGQGSDTLESIESAELRADDNSRTLLVNGFTGPVTLIGGAGNDKLFGGIGNDSLDGRGGDDSLAGGPGDDLYRFTSIDLGASVGPFGFDEVIESATEGVDTLDFGSLDIAGTLIDISGSTIFADTLGFVLSIDSAELENVIGTLGDDEIFGNANPNRLDGGKGNDSIVGGGGADVLVGGPGDDQLTTSPGGDRLLFEDAEEPETDTLVTTGNVYSFDFRNLSADQGLAVNLKGEEAAKHLNRLVVLGSAYTAASYSGVTVFGSNGPDQFIDGPGSQTYVGGGGDDTFEIDGGSTDIDQVAETTASGIDLLDFSSFSENLRVDLTNPTLASYIPSGGGMSTRVIAFGALHFENVTTGSGDDLILGNDLPNRFDGGLGSDSMAARGGDDVYLLAASVFGDNDEVTELAGEGTDEINFAGASQAYFINLAIGSASYFGRGVSFDEIENATGGNLGDRLIGNDEDNVLVGGPGNDRLDGGQGDDELRGDAGDDRYEFGPLRTFISGGVLRAESETDTLFDDSGIDRLDFSDLNASQAVGLVVDLSMGGLFASHTSSAVGGFRSIFSGDSDSIFEQATGSAGNDRLIGNDLDNRLWGGPGDDVIRGGRGDDFIVGEAGNDQLFGEQGSDLLRALTGNEQLDGGPGNDVYSLFFAAATADSNVVITESPALAIGGVISDGGRDAIVLPDYVNAFNLSNFDLGLSTTPPETSTGFLDGANRLTVDLLDSSGTRNGANFENLIAISETTDLIGNASNNVLFGGDVQNGVAGNNLLFGMDGLDTMTGGPGDDLVVGGTVDLGVLLTFFNGDRRDLASRLVELQREWTRTSVPVAERIATLTAGIGDPELKQRLVVGGADATVFDDGFADAIVVGGGDNWVLPPDSASDSSGAAGIGEPPALAADLPNTNPPTLAAGNKTSEPTALAAGLSVNVNQTKLPEASAYGTPPGPESAPGMPLLRANIIPVLTRSSASATTPPTPLSIIDEGQAFFAELWVQSTMQGAAGLTGMFVDVVFDPEHFVIDTDAGEVNEEFPLVNHGTSRPDRGLVDDLGGATLRTDLAANESWVRLGLVRMVAGSGGTATLAALPGMVEPAQVGVGNIAWNDVELNDATLEIRALARVVDRGLFYPGTSFGDAIDPSKQALLSATMASFENYTGTLDGITGVQIDVEALDGYVPTMADFEFRTGNTDDPNTWGLANPPDTFEFISGGGADGTDRVMMTWTATNSIKNAWLQITMLATEANRLAGPDVHYWGNQIGETGNVVGNTAVNALDVGAIVNNQTGFSPAGNGNRFDLDRNNIVNALDVGIAVNNQTGFSSLILFTPPSGSFGRAEAPMFDHGSSHEEYKSGVDEYFGDFFEFELLPTLG